MNQSKVISLGEPICRLMSGNNKNMKYQAIRVRGADQVFRLGKGWHWIVTDDNHFCWFEGSDYYDDQERDEARAKRLAACLNHCEGIPTDKL